MTIPGKRILALVMLPPPLHGASGINLRMLDVLSKHGADVVTLNLVPSRQAALFDSALWKVLRALRTLLLFWRIILMRGRGRPAAVYFGISGGMGQIFDCVLAVAVRLHGVPVFIHHHSFAYVSKTSRLFQLFRRLLPVGGVTHIVLCKEMTAGLRSHYNDLLAADHFVEISNAAFFPGGKTRVTGVSRPLCLGYISNITLEKGIGDFIDLYARCREQGISVSGRIAGPCMSQEVRRLLAESVSRLPGLEYIGPVYGAQKDAFFEVIDVLVFPTRYANEAEPLIIHEAAEFGVPAVAYARGCIASMVERCGGMAVPVETPFLDVALEYVTRCAGDSVFLESRARDALAGSSELKGLGKDNLEVLVQRMLTDAISTP